MREPTVSYQDWIAKYYPTEQDAYGECAEATAVMASVFPELRRVRGHYYCAVWGERAHWWLVTTDGEIVDPTAEQFPTRGAGVYIEHVEGSEEPIGKCPNCDGYVYGGGTVCSDACAREYEAYCVGGR